MTKKTISLGGKLYDAETGLPISNGQSQPAFTKIEQSKTLNRQFVKKPNLKSQPRHEFQANSNPRIRQLRRFNNQMLPQPQAKSDLITHFEKGKFNHTDDPIVISAIKTPDVKVSAQKDAQIQKQLAEARKLSKFKSDIIRDIARQRRLQQQKMNAQAMRIAQQKQISDISPKRKSSVETRQPATKSSRDLKNEIINKALANAPSSDDLVKKHRQKNKKSWSKVLSLLTASLAILLLVGYLTYINIPNIKLKIAASQAGFSSSYPEYKPIGYSLAKPAEFNDGKISMRFSNNELNYVINQQKSNWSSAEVLANLVQKEVGENYTINQDRGLTIYVFNNDSSKRVVWVNQGILYEIEADQSIPNNQLHSIATSM